MYMHAHLRYAQALAHVGRADDFFHALCQADPIGIRAVVPAATLRQANCYYSSSDAGVRGSLPGARGVRPRPRRHHPSRWRLARVFQRRRHRARADAATIPRAHLGIRDPVHRPRDARGAGRDASTHFVRGHPLEVTYRVGYRGLWGQRNVALNGEALPFARAANPHRPGAARVAAGKVLEGLTRDPKLPRHRPRLGAAISFRSLPDAQPLP